MPHDLSILQNTHDDFYAFGLSAMDTSVDIITGRPYGGTAILYHKKLATKVKVLESHDSRITCLTIITDVGVILLINVYMPTNYGDETSLENYIETCTKINAFIIDTDAMHVIIMGDFNCQEGSRFYGEFLNLVSEHNLIIADMTRLHDAFTYISDDGRNISWIDHVLVSPAIDKIINNIEILNDVIMSDHRPLALHISCNVMETLCPPTASERHGTVNWSDCGTDVLSQYSQLLDDLLGRVNVPQSVLNLHRYMH